MKNQTLIKAGKRILKRLLSKCTDEEVMMFKRMYCHNNLDYTIDQCLVQIDPDNIDWAITQCERTFQKEQPMYEQNIGCRVTKTSKTGTKPKPFKSQLLVNTVKDVITHPILNIPAYTFEEDDSYVECRRCKLVIA
jgi:hypothetical protein